MRESQPAAWNPLAGRRHICNGMLDQGALMATMIPHDIDEFTTEGERKFYSFLETFAKPDREFTTWYLPDIAGKEPDFILYCEEIGLIVFEVKDWELSQILEANPSSFKLRMGKATKSLKSPLHQAREYLNSLKDRLKADGRLLSTDAAHYGNPKVPIDYGVVFPNIRKDEYCRRGLDRVINLNRVFLWDDLHASSEICLDGSGRCFRRKLRDMFPPRFRFSITRAEYNHLKHLLFPVVRITQPERDACAYVDPSRRLKVLDDRQEALARRFSPGRHIITGPPGTGKTLILVHKAVFLRLYRQNVKNMLFVCHNASLVNYVKRLLSAKKAGFGPGGVEVCHFFELCSKILGEEIRFDSADKSYYELVVQETLARQRTEGVKYDAVLVDEGQDFTPAMGKVIVNLLDPDSNDLTVALDEGQSLYGEGTFWDVQGNGATVRIDRVNSSHRFTSEIRQFVFGFMEYENAGESALQPECAVHGPKPVMTRMGDIGELVFHVADMIKALHACGEYPLSEMAVLYSVRFTRDAKGERVSLPELLIGALESRGIIADWTTENYSARRSYDISTDRVCVSAIHGARGLDWACVFLLGLDELAPDIGLTDRARRYAFVGMTRARHRLCIPYVRRNALIRNLSTCL